MTTALHVTVWDEAAAAAPSIVLIHGSMTWGAVCFERQRSLAEHYRLVVPDRRGYAASPDVEHSDYEVDAADVLGLSETDRRRQLFAYRLVSPRGP